MRRRSRRSMLPDMTNRELPAAVADLMSRLSRGDTHLVLERESETTHIVRMVRSIDGTSRMGATVDWSSFVAARDDGLVAFDATRNGWRLTTSGRAAVRRRRSRSILPMIGPGSHVVEMASPLFNETESPLAWLRRRADKGGQPLVGNEQYDAGERLRADLYYARLTPRVTSPWTGIPRASGPRAAPGVGIEMPDRVVAAKQRVMAALVAVGPELAGILIDVCGHLHGLEAIERREKWPKRSAKLVLHKALTALARHYGLLPPATVDQMITLRLRHWGADDYRPVVTEPGPPSR